jgi:hypothetical protein
LQRESESFSRCGWSAAPRRLESYARPDRPLRHARNGRRGGVSRRSEDSCFYPWSRQSSSVRRISGRRHLDRRSQAGVSRFRSHSPWSSSAAVVSFSFARARPSGGFAITARPVTPSALAAAASTLMPLSATLWLLLRREAERRPACRAQRRPPGCQPKSNARTSKRGERHGCRQPAGPGMCAAETVEALACRARPGGRAAARSASSAELGSGGGSGRQHACFA